MTMQSDRGAEPRDRVVDRTVEIDAPVEAVWAALTEARELQRWFPLEAEVRPGLGGAVRLRWDDSYDETSSIELWEPPHRLRLAFPVHHPMAMATDYLLEGQRGRTVLRVVTSGFEAGADWDGMYDGVSTGWDFELLGLKHYLERHRGRDRQVAFAYVPYTLSREAAWERLMGPAGWFRPEAQGDYTVGGGFAGHPAGHPISGQVRLWNPPRQIAGIAANLNDALFRLETLEHAKPGEAWIWLSTYDVPAAQVRGMEADWRRSLAEALQEPA